MAFLMKMLKMSTGSTKAVLSSCDVFVTHTGALSPNKAYLGNVVSLYTLLTITYKVPISVSRRRAPLHFTR